jgi:alpha-ketoglutarate-dependent taurine dioxygenase
MISDNKQSGLPRGEIERQLVVSLAKQDRPNDPNDALMATVEAIRGRVEGDAAVAVVRGFDAVEGENQRTAFREFCAAFGELTPQDGNGTIIREVRDRGKVLAEGRSGRYSDTRSGGNLHTDGAEAPSPVPDYLSLLCVRPAMEGGELVLVDVRDLVDRLDPEVAELLRQPFHFDRRGDEREGDQPTTAKPILFEDAEGQFCASYLRRYIEVGHKRPEVPNLTAEQIAALDAFDALLQDTELSRSDRLDAGEVAVIDNRRMLHGRTEFVDARDPARHRLLLRTWIKKG